ncbi:MAG: PKD domain-containing protein [Bacteroidota bacterium]
MKFKPVQVLLLVILLLGATQVRGQISFNADTLSGCVPLHVNFQGNSAGSPVSWEWTFTNQNTGSQLPVVRAQNPVITFLDAGQYSVKLKVNYANGTSDSLTKSNYILAISAPQPVFSIPDTIECFNGNSISFLNQTIGAYNSLQWFFGDGNTSSIASPTHNYSASGVFDVTLIIYANGCSSSLTKDSSVTILSNPASVFSADTLSTCDASHAFAFAVDTTQASGVVSYLWNFGDGNTSTSPNPQHVFGGPGTYDVTLVTVNAFGCSDTSTALDYITVLNNPVPSISVSGGLMRCVPVYATISTNTTGIHALSWDFGNGVFSSQPSNQQNFFNPGSYPISLTATYSNGCQNTSIDTLVARPLTSAYFTVTPNSGCAPLNVSLNHVAADPGLTYLWLTGRGDTLTSGPVVNLTYSNAGSYLPSLTVTNSHGCSNTQYAVNPITVNAVNAQFTADDIDGCPPHTVNFNHPGGGGYSYLWNFGDGSTSNLQSPSHTYVNPGSYQVSLTVTNQTYGCASTYLMPSNVQISNGVNNFGPPDTIYGCAPYTANLFDNSPSSSSWNWDFGDGGTSNAQNAIHTYANPGTYTVSLQTQSNGNSCSQSISPFITYVLTEGYAGFTMVDSACAPFVTSFTDTSSNAVSWFWDFGDGNTSTLQNPTHIYANPGTYNVSLTITTSNGCSYTTVQNFAANFQPLYADPNGTILSLNPPTLAFQANSIGATAWTWIFGDGDTSYVQDPTHVYPANGGPYDLTLVIYNNGCSDTLFFPAVVGGSSGTCPPSAGNGNGTNPPPTINTPDPIQGCAPFATLFRNPTQGAVSCVWYFGDGDSSTAFNPSHIYENAGVYSVTLLTTNANGTTDTIFWSDLVVVSGVTAAFSYTMNSGCSGSTVNINNNSTTGVNYLWSFGDTNHSTLFEPSHQYTTVGINYLISLTVTDSTGCTASKSVTYYSSGNNPISANKRKACAWEPIAFSSNNPGFVSYHWDFDNGATSNLENPVYSFPDGGLFNVSLTAIDAAQCTTVFNLSYQIEINAPVADFTFTLINNSCNPPTVNFTNLSTGATSYLWDFGNGQYSSLASPQHTLVAFGYHDVTLIATAGSCSDTLSLNDYANRPSIAASFNFTQDGVCFPITATFIDQSVDAVSWLWDFGDNATSTQQNPVHVFNSMPDNPITLYVWNAVGCMNAVSLPNINAMNVSVNQGDSLGCSPLAFQFSGLSSMPASWSWNFGNGDIMSFSNDTLVSGSYLYLGNGSYPVSVAVTAPTGCTQTIPLATVSTSGPIADFNFTPNNSCAPTIVNFEDLSTGAQAWSWSLGNGNNSSLQNPLHVYNVPGVYDIELVVTDSSGCMDTLVVPNAIEITGTYTNFTASSLTGCAPHSVSFSDSSINATNWFWNFGDGDSSNFANPTHVFSQPGVYYVILTTSDSAGCTSYFQLPDSIVVYGNPEASYSLNSNTGCAPFSVSPSNLSTNAVSYFWDFVDGSSSTDASPTHIYQNSGIYWISLVAMGQGGCSDTFMLSTPVTVGEIPNGGITSSVASGCAPLSSNFSPNITNADSSATYVWSYNGVVQNGSTANMTFNQNGTHQVQLIVTNMAGCSNSFQSSVLVYGADTLGPVVIRSASVSDENQVELKWADIIHPELDHYDIYRLNTLTNSYQLVHTSNNTMPVNPDVYQTWFDNGVQTSDRSNTYIVQAVNICGLSMPLDRHTSHSTVNLEVDMGNSSPQLQWNNYGGCTPVGGYLVQRMDEEGTSWNNLAILPSNVTTYQDSSVYCTDSVTYRITSLDLCGLPIFDAFSDIEDVLAPGSLLIQRVDMVRSTVEDDAWVLTEWSAPSLAPQLVTGYELFRSTDNVNFSRIAVLPAVQTSYEDYDVTVKSQNYYYRVKVSNTCSLEASSGFESSSILLMAQPDERYGIQLRWTPYKNWSTGVDEYVIEEWNSQSGTWEYVKTVDGSTTESDVQ